MMLGCSPRAPWQLDRALLGRIQHTFEALCTGAAAAATCDLAAPSAVLRDFVVPVAANAPTAHAQRYWAQELARWLEERAVLAASRLLAAAAASAAADGTAAQTPAPPQLPHRTNGEATGDGNRPEPESEGEDERVLVRPHGNERRGSGDDYGGGDCHERCDRRQRREWQLDGS